MPTEPNPFLAKLDEAVASSPMGQNRSRIMSMMSNLTSGVPSRMFNKKQAPQQPPAATPAPGAAPPAAGFQQLNPMARSALLQAMIARSRGAAAPGAAPAAPAAAPGA